MSVRIMVGNARDMLATLPDACVDLTVTSPPYDNLREYGGFSFDFLDDFTVIAHELYRVTKPGGVVVWVSADSTVRGTETGSSFRQALYFKDMVEFNLYDTMIWNKGAPSVPTQGRYYNVFEFMFVFTKGAPKTLNLIADRKNKHPGRVNKYETCIGKTGTVKTGRLRVTPDSSRRYNIWEQTTGGLAKFCREHPAAFPEQLAADHIASWSNPGDMVLDPFFGSGTTGLAAARLGRNCIGIDINAAYADLASARLTAAGLSVTIEHPHQPAAELEAAE